ncbi:MAG: TonB family protein [Dokdonella sp.]
MRTSIAYASAVAFLLLASAVIEAKEPTLVVLSVSWDISLDASGNITKLTTDDEQVPTVHARLEKAIRGWHFSPGKVNGQPMATESHLSISLEFKPVAEGYEMRLLGAATGAYYGKLASAHYPTEAAREGKQGEVVLLVHYTGTGVVTDVAPYEDGPKADARLTHAAMASVKKWTFATEVVGGYSMAGVALVPVCFTLSGRTPPPCDWKNPATGESLSAGQAVALNPAAKLETDVIGRVL